MHKASYGHLDSIAYHSMTATTVDRIHRSVQHTRKASNASLQDFWVAHEHDAALESLQSTLAWAKGMEPVDGDKADTDRGATTSDKV